MSDIRDFALQNKRFVAAHRGASGTAPENTMSAFEEALNAGAKMLEIDIQVTSDNKLVVLHDTSLLEKQHGIKLENNSFSYDEIKDIDIGSWFAPRFSFERIPLLSDVLDFVKSRDAYVNIEIKSNDDSLFYRNVQNILDVVKKTGTSNKVLFASFDYKSLSEIKKIDPSFPTAAVRLPGDKRMPSEIASQIKCEAMIFSLEELNEIYCDDAINNNLYTGVYSVDSIEALHYALKFDVAAIGTDYPALIIQEMKKMNILN